MNLAPRVARVAGATVTMLLLAPAIAAGPSVDQPTFVDDMAPILHANCVSCHQPGEIGPMSLRTYREVRPWARSIARAVDRGKSMHFSAELPDGSTRDLLRVSRYDFNWQTTYQLAEPIRLPAGTRIHVKAVFDNSADNPSNPDPTVDPGGAWNPPTIC